MTYNIVLGLCGWLLLVLPVSQKWVIEAFQVSNSKAQNS